MPHTSDLPIIASAPIGVFDSGVGGLSVLREIRQLLPAETLLYVADSGFAPYGDKSDDYIIDRVTQIVHFFLTKQVKAIVVACNTATSVAVDVLRSWCPVPIVAMEPAIKPAALHTKTGVVGVLATTQTLSSANVYRLIATHGQDIQILTRACTGFVERVEQGALADDETKRLVQHHLAPLLRHGVDTLVLGCTHYPFLASCIAQVAGDHVLIIDPSAAIARELKRRLDEQQHLNQTAMMGSMCFWTSGDLVRVTTILSQLWGESVRVHAFKP